MGGLTFEEISDRRLDIIAVALEESLRFVSGQVSELLNLFDVFGDCDGLLPYLAANNRGYLLVAAFVGLILCGAFLRGHQLMCCVGGCVCVKEGSVRSMLCFWRCKTLPHINLSLIEKEGNC